ncbi:uncharacterized protein B0P05DRAFT_535023 [Gilbertella persicaria]|uniref:uncharacterized protein n=1 Tax=Gilbertella persicaria TaxID=101096 RepID=UPI0022204865|nr:uncharacterized protein B0P05DRAFT_535023 [Gilbertella persicaria]KAI8084304.1 hypothetical protein B0P05DRAFT_535023 [Gilbertella persicaria]
MIDVPVSNRLYALLGSSPDAPEIANYAEFKPTLSEISNYVYYAYKPLGISFCFIKDNDTLKLDAIDIYNGNTRDGFSPFHAQEHLPCGLTPTMQAHQIVSLLGEPDRKGGGGQTRTPCWIEYKFNQNSGILIQLHGFEWEDREMGWTSFVLY